jgi:hypothetical protein
MNKTVDILLEDLYKSNDPLCFEAAVRIEAYEILIAQQEKSVADISLGAKYMLESLMEISKMARDRDKTPGPTTKEELRLRLKECGGIAMDTINLTSVKKAYERMYNE